jgi:hypothetical protein
VQCEKGHVRFTLESGHVQCNSVCPLWVSCDISQQIIVIRSLRDPPAGQHVRGRAHAPARGASGQIDVAGTMQTITTVVEGSVCEHPEQWL